MLCARCQTKKRKNKITDIDIRVSKSLVSLSPRFPQLQSTSLRKAVRVDSTFILGVTQRSLPIFQDNNLLSALENDLRAPVKAVVLTSDYRIVLSSLFAPLEVLGVDTVFVPDGSQELKVRLKGILEKSAPSIELLCRMAAALLGYAIRADFISEIERTDNISKEPEY